jgi:hypothetical protein
VLKKGAAAACLLLLAIVALDAVIDAAGRESGDGMGHKSKHGQLNSERCQRECEERQVGEVRKA